MTDQEIRRWDRINTEDRVKNTSNMGWIEKYHTFGCISGENIYYHGKTDEELAEAPLFHYHPICIADIFATNAISVEATSGGKLCANDIEILCHTRDPMISNWSYIYPWHNNYFSTNVLFLQKIILKQDKAIDKLKEEKRELEGQILRLNNVCN